MINIFLVISVSRNFLKIVIWRSTEEHILVRNLFIVISISRNFLMIVIWRITKRHILVRNTFLVTSVSKFVLKIVIWKCTKEHKLVRNLFPVINVSRIFIFCHVLCDSFFAKMCCYKHHIFCASQDYHLHKMFWSSNHMENVPTSMCSFVTLHITILIKYLSQGGGFSPVCVLLCIFRLLFNKISWNNDHRSKLSQQYMIS